jgi:thioredoxin 1
MRPIYVKDIKTSSDLIYSLNRYSEGKEKLCVVMFTASWCTPCQRIKKEIYDESKSEGMSVRYMHDVVFVYVDIEENPQLAKEFNVESVPVFQFMVCSKKNEAEFVAAKISGGNKSKIIDTIEDFIRG